MEEKFKFLCFSSLPAIRLADPPDSIIPPPSVPYPSVFTLACLT